jgi:hypothetical protein
MGVFGVSAWDINVNSKLTDILGAKNLHYAVRLNDAGDFGFEVSLSDQLTARVAHSLMELDGNPFKVCITSGNDAVILYTGIVWQSNRKPGSSTIEFAGKALMSYFQEITIQANYTSSIAPAQLIHNVMADTQAVAGANRGISTIITGNNPPPNITPDYRFDQYPTVAQVISDQTAAVTPGTGGVDYFIADQFVNGAPAHTMHIVTPRSGRVGAASGLTLDLGRATDWSWPTDNIQTGNHVIVIGSGDGNNARVATADGVTPRGGLGQPPRLDLVLQYSQIKDQNQLQGIANGSARQFGQPITTPTVTVPYDYAPCALGTFSIGDDVTVWSEPSIWFPLGLSEVWRIVAYEVTVPDEGVPLVTFTLNPPPVF